MSTIQRQTDVFVNHSQKLTQKFCKNVMIYSIIMFELSQKHNDYLFIYGDRKAIHKTGSDEKA